MAAGREAGAVGRAAQLALWQEAEATPYAFDASYRTAAVRRVAGVDEAGRGPLAGPVVAAAVVLAPEQRFVGLDDSKRVKEADRERLYDEIVAVAQGWAVGVADVAEIDAVNILQATRRAMARAVAGLGSPPDLLLVDAVVVPCSVPQHALVKGDQRSASIAAASILAKVTRDRMMAEYERRYPGYGFGRHKGYPTQAHRRALRALGPTPIHRTTFRGVRELLDG
jgi:ribonuclease HII